MIAPEVLRSFPFFRGGTRETLDTLAMVSEEVRFQAGDELFREGEPADYLYVLVRGEVEIEYVSVTGQRRAVDRLGEGDLMVWSAVVEPYLTTAFARARTDCEAVAVDAARLRQLLAEDCDLGFSLMTELVKVTANRLKGARAQIASMG